MGAVQSGVVSQLIRLLPQPLLNALDAWSYRIARQRALQRQRQWAARKAR